MATSIEQTHAGCTLDPPMKNEKVLYFKLEVVKFCRKKLSDSQLDVGLSAMSKNVQKLPLKIVS